MTYNGKQFLVRAIMECATGLPADRIVNDFVFEYVSTPVTADFVNIEGHVSDFYRAAQSTGSRHIGQYISPYVSRSATHHIDIYQLAAPTLGSPVYTDTWLGPTNPDAANPIPAECAAVLSFHADLTSVAEFGPTVSTIPSDEDAIDQGAPSTHSGVERHRARRRGRLYIGPLMTNAVHTTVAPYMLDSDFLTTLREAAVKMCTDAAGDDWTWSVWSRRDQTTYPVVGGWTDNAPDTQRRRGPAASTRVTYSC